MRLFGKFCFDVSETDCHFLLKIVVAAIREPRLPISGRTSRQAMVPDHAKSWFRMAIPVLNSEYILILALTLCPEPNKQTKINKMISGQCGSVD